jgi:shikimate kinase/3-dehydroquinate synthase
VEKVSTTAPGAPPSLDERKLVLVGFMGAGKTSAARLGAERLGLEALDTDALLEDRLGEPIEAFFDREGEPAFREREEALVVELLSGAGPAVVALGGGAVTSERVRDVLRRHVCVYLDVDSETAWGRAGGSGRPLARDRERFLRLHAERAPLYESLADAVVSAGTPSIGEAIDAALRLAGPDTPEGVRLVWATTPSPPHGYPVYVGGGALEALRSWRPADGRLFVVADERVMTLHGQRLTKALGGRVQATVTVAPGESQKSLAEAERVLRSLARAGMQRTDVLVAFGGGVVGDLAGLCAALYQRGVAVVQVPTTLVAQVDSAYGGKTGVDLPEAKNYAGAFHQPVAVFTDPDLLSTLPVEELRAGFAEVIKTALIAGGELWQRVRSLEPVDRALAGSPDAMTDLVERCLSTKLRIVAEDEREDGLRASLNLGHTFAHALEAATGYASFRHGEAVALGMLVALRLSERELGLDPAVREQVAELYGRHGLPVAFSGPPTDELLERSTLDKKRRGDRANLVLLRFPGEVLTGCNVGEEELREAIDELRMKSSRDDAQTAVSDRGRV